MSCARRSFKGSVSGWCITGSLTANHLGFNLVNGSISDRYRAFASFFCRLSIFNRDWLFTKWIQLSNAVHCFGDRRHSDDNAFDGCKSSLQSLRTASFALVQHAVEIWWLIRSWLTNCDMTNAVKCAHFSETSHFIELKSSFPFDILSVVTPLFRSSKGVSQVYGLGSLRSQDHILGCPCLPSTYRGGPYAPQRLVRAHGSQWPMVLVRFLRYAISYNENNSSRISSCPSLFLSISIFL